MNVIDNFSGSYDFLSNFHPSPITFEGIEYATVEHAYQAAKTESLEEKRAIAALTTAGRAKRMGKRVALRANWESVKVEIMAELVRLKFTSYANLREQLLATGDTELVEGNSWGDTFWGVCRGEGRNELGRILMQVRGELAAREEARRERASN